MLSRSCVIYVVKLSLHHRKHSCPTGYAPGCQEGQRKGAASEEHLSFLVIITPPGNAPGCQEAQRKGAATEEHLSLLLIITPPGYAPGCQEGQRKGAAS